MANPCVSAKLCSSVVSDDVGNELSEVFPACAVTSAMARQRWKLKSLMRI